MKSLDAIDIAIIEALQADGRLALSVLAKQVGLSGTACTERVRGLEASGVITGYTATIDAARIGLGLLVFVEISLERISGEAFKEFRRAVAAIPEIEECHMVAGGFDYLLKIRVPDMEAYRAFLAEALAQVPGIRQTHSYPVMEQIRLPGAVGLQHLTRKAAM